MFVVTMTQEDGYTFAYEVSADRLDHWLAVCETVLLDGEGLTVMAAHLYAAQERELGNQQLVQKRCHIH